MSAAKRFDDVIQRLEAFKAELARQNEQWAAAKGQLQSAGDVQFACESLPEVAPEPVALPLGIRG